MKISPQKLISFLVSQGSSSKKVEMLDFWGLDASIPSSSALNQQRAKLKPEALEAVFKQFNSSIMNRQSSTLSHDKYRFLAADGSTCTYFSTPVFSSEDKANYFDYFSKHRQPDELVIYHGGRYSPSKKIFLQAVAHASEALPWYHWGDIDYGGFSMLARLRSEISGSIQPYRMNKQELITFAAFTTSFTPEYSHKLRELTARAELKDCSECITYMLECCVRLEQEALLE